MFLPSEIQRSNDFYVWVSQHVHHISGVSERLDQISKMSIPMKHHVNLACVQDIIEDKIRQIDLLGVTFGFDLRKTLRSISIKSPIYIDLEKGANYLASIRIS
jgi:hypothetical protein